MDRMSKFAYPRKRIRMRIPAREAPRMRIHMRMPVHENPRMRIHMRIPVSRYPRMWVHMRIPVSRYPRMRTGMRIFVTYLNNASYCQMGAALLQNTDYYIIIIIPNIYYWLQSVEDFKFVINLDEFQPQWLPEVVRQPLLGLPRVTSGYSIG